MNDGTYVPWFLLHSLHCPETLTLSNQREWNYARCQLPFWIRISVPYGPQSFFIVYSGHRFDALENAMFEETWTNTIWTRVEVPLHHDKIPVYYHQGSENEMPFSQLRTTCKDQSSFPPFKGLCWLQLKMDGKEHLSNVPTGQTARVWSSRCVSLCYSLVLKLYFIKIKTEDTPPAFS